ncbi:hypothetical protein PORY_002570 [Pneumocystis oryctolagi]|uniref:Uncharacterized protein n=1 Tax=Pneumocystis oryctolagi TaxID=42067 RepID=A0ACB7CC40_9ASCO|nr:hypothetical protein PORY_002570 [Pneumocystis oryctolagi]
MDEKLILEAIKRLKIDCSYVIEHEDAPFDVSWKKALKKCGYLTEYVLTRIWASEIIDSTDESEKLVLTISFPEFQMDTASVAGALKCKTLQKASSKKVFDILSVKNEEISPLCITKHNASKIRVVLDFQIFSEKRLLAFRLLSTRKTVFFTSHQLLDHFSHLGIEFISVNFSLKPLDVKKISSFEKSSSCSFKEDKQNNVLIGITVKKNDDFSEWYRQVLIKGDMPASYYVWEKIQRNIVFFSILNLIGLEWFDTEIKKLGVENCYFPMFISSRFLEKEKDHIEGFAPEVAWVTKAGDSDLEEPIAIRPTSETSMYSYYSKWIRSYRDLPLKLNQWNSVVRWEFSHPQPFLRSREFLWQEGHTAYLNKEESEKEVFDILRLYEKVYSELLSVPVIAGIKSEKETFAGAVFTATIEGFVPSVGRGIQAATSHSLGQNFSKMFDICVENPDMKDEISKLYVWQNSWGLSTRAIGIMIMTHSDDKGLVIPPKVSRIQIVVVPCGITAKTTSEEQKIILDDILGIVETLKKDGFRVESDLRTTYSPGWKFSHWEMKGIPLRLEYGFKDHDMSQVVAVRRDTGEKVKIPLLKLSSSVSELLETIQTDLYKKAKKKYDESIQIVYEWKDFVPSLNKKKLVLIPWCKRTSCEEEIKKNSASETNVCLEGGNVLAMGAKSLCIPLEQPTGEHFLEKGVTCCTACGEPAIVFALFDTEIDWKTYMTQASIYLSGERNYVHIKGSTGPVVYPAGFLYLYSFLYKLTNGGENLIKAQSIFMCVYLTTLFFVMKIYHAVNAPFYIYPLLIFSKRLHSIYLLRLFNDCWVMLFSYIAIYAYVMHSWVLGTCFFGIALGIKMNVFLFFPAIVMILLQVLGMKRMLYHLFLIFVIQVLLFIPFMSYKREYFSRAFDFSRAFLYKWTVNWKFLPESVFLSSGFAYSLLFVHGLMLFIFSSRQWNRISGYSLKKIFFSSLNMKLCDINKTYKTSAQIRPLIVITLFTSNLIGIVCARSLHYQFYSWFAWSIPYILTQTHIPVVLQFIVWALQEYAWNVYPSTAFSSFIIVITYILILFLLLIRY